MRDYRGEYMLLLQQFLNGSLSVDEFQKTYLARFKNEEPMNEKLFELLDELFADLDSFTSDAKLLARKPGFYIDESALRNRVRNIAERISALP